MTAGKRTWEGEEKMSLLGGEKEDWSAEEKGRPQVRRRNESSPSYSKNQRDIRKWERMETPERRR